MKQNESERMRIKSFNVLLRANHARKAKWPAFKFQFKKFSNVHTKRKIYS